MQYLESCRKWGINSLIVLTHHHACRSARGGSSLWHHWQCVCCCFQLSVQALHFSIPFRFRPISLETASTLVLNSAFYTLQVTFIYLQTAKFRPSQHIHIGTMSSADFSQQALLRVYGKIYPHVCETSPDKNVIFPPYTHQIYYVWFRIVIGLCFVLQTYPHTLALYLISVRQVRLLPPASFRFHIAMDTLAFGYTIPTIRAR